MKKAEIKVGGLYTARVSGNFVTVRVDAIREVTTTRGTDYRTGRGKPCDVAVYDVTNLKTGRKTTFRSAAKFRSVASNPTVGPIPCSGWVTDNDPTGPMKNRCRLVKGHNGPCHDGLPPIQPEPLTPPVPPPATYKPELDPRDESEKAFDAANDASMRECGLPVDVVEVEQRSDPTATAVATAVEPACTVEPSPSTCHEPHLGATNSLAAQIADVPAITGHKPTDEQQAILDLVRGMTEGVCVIEAGAGTGKTSTLKMVEQLMPGIGQYTAFNRSLVAESKSKFKRAACNTTHSLAFRAVGKRYVHRLKTGRVFGEEIARRLDIKTMHFVTGVNANGTLIKKSLDAALLAAHTMSAIRNFCQSADRTIEGKHFRYIAGIDQPTIDGGRTYANNDLVKECLLPFARKAWVDLNREDGNLPFTPDHYVKIWQLDNPVIAGDYILLDEAQDTAPVMLDVLRQQKALIILVGDSAQQIYEWRGAVNALAGFEGAPRRYLSQSFRFGQAVADVANSVLESMMDKVALRLKGLPAIDSKVTPVEQPDCILCRTNATAVATVLNTIAAGKRPHLIGGGTEMVKFVEAALDLQSGRPTSHPELACFSSWNEVTVYSQMDEGEDLKLQVKLINEFGAKEILAGLKNMPAEKDADLVISTAHKSKGREWDTVRLAQDFPTNSKSTDSDRKLLYVAVTRAKLVLDISQCPFFTGQDALEIKRTAPAEGANAVQPATKPVNGNGAPKGPPVGFTWARGKNGKTWLLRGPRGQSGQRVDVVRANGSISKATVGPLVWENTEVALYQVG